MVLIEGFVEDCPLAPRVRSPIGLSLLAEAVEGTYSVLKPLLLISQCILYISATEVPIQP
jgi:hypothetical protein